jgi:omega-hydroxy-beta-dihydromenaquinone-9 sulfotransferase
MKRRLRLSLRAWSRVASTRAQISWRARFLYGLTAAAYSSLLRIQHASHADALRAAVPLPPIFVLGFWRSGTTLLHELLCCDQRWGFPSTYTCLNPAHCLLTESWVTSRALRQQGIRPMDNMRFSWESPQEDEFALLALGAPSPYEALIVPSLLRDPKSLLDLRSLASEEQSCWIETLHYFLQLVTVQQGKAMVLKSPPHGFRLPLLSSLFPASRYVLIERNPYEVFASNLKLWQTLLDKYSVESFSTQEIEEFVLAAYLLHEAAIAEGASNLSPQSFVRVRYEELVADPMGKMAELYEKMEFGQFEAVRPRIQEYVRRVAGHVRNPLCLSPAQKENIDNAWGDLIREKRYAWPANEVSVA